MSNCKYLKVEEKDDWFTGFSDPYDHPSYDYFCELHQKELPLGARYYCPNCKDKVEEKENEQM